jgi:hypothetical protein
MVTDPCGVALKEWAAVCEALAAGRQTILLRKGGLVERSGTFEVEHRRFWLYPTYLHQQEQGLAEADRGFLDAAKAKIPPAGYVDLSLLAEVVEAWHLTTPEAAASLRGQHVWTDETIASRFAYRKPGLTLLVLRVHRAETAHRIDETEEQAGCRSWVPLAAPLDPGTLTPVLDGTAFAQIQFVYQTSLLTTDGVRAVSAPPSLA